MQQELNQIRIHLTQIFQDSVLPSLKISLKAFHPNPLYFSPLTRRFEQLNTPDTNVSNLESYPLLLRHHFSFNFLFDSVFHASKFVL